MIEWLNGGTHKLLKVKSFEFTSEVVITILRINDSLKTCKRKSLAVS